MPATGHDWGAFAFVQESAGDWNATALVDDATDTSDPITVDTKSAIIIGMAFAVLDVAVADNSITIAILGTFDDTSYEAAPGLAGAQVGNPFKFTITPIQDGTVYVQFSINPTDYNLFKIAVVNESGQTVGVSCKIKTSDVPVAS